MKFNTKRCLQLSTSVGYSRVLAKRKGIFLKKVMKNERIIRDPDAMLCNAPDIKSSSKSSSERENGGKIY